jgi:glucose dehydrogenase
VWALDNGKGWFQRQGKFVSDIRADDTGVYRVEHRQQGLLSRTLSGKIKWQYWGSGAAENRAGRDGDDGVNQYVPGQGVVGIDKMQGEFNRKPRLSVKMPCRCGAKISRTSYLRRRDNRLIAVDKKTGQVVFTSKAQRLLDASRPTRTTRRSTPPRKDGHVAAIRPVLREGEVGTLVMGFKEDDVR